eukprot:scaffold4098_cov154-Skeletonema_marinoi.AAC.10
MVFECDLAAIPNYYWTSSGHLRGCSMAYATTESMSNGIYPSMLTLPALMGHPSILSLPTLMGHYKLFITPFTVLDMIWC